MCDDVEPLVFTPHQSKELWWIDAQSYGPGHTGQTLKWRTSWKVCGRIFLWTSTLTRGVISKCIRNVCTVTRYVLMILEWAIELSHFLYYFNFFLKSSENMFRCWLWDYSKFSCFELKLYHFKQLFSSFLQVIGVSKVKYSKIVWISFKFLKCFKCSSTFRCSILFRYSALLRI